MHWIEEYSFKVRISKSPFAHSLGETEYFPNAEAEALAEIEKRLGGKVKSTRHTHLSETGACSMQYAEALVELP